MTPKQIEKNLEEVSNSYGENADKVVLLAKLKRGAGDSRREILQRIARQRGEPVAEVRKMLEGWVPGVLFRAESVRYYASDGDEVLTDGEQFESSGDTMTWRPEQINWSSVEVIDEESLEAEGPPTVDNLFKASEASGARRRRSSWDSFRY